MSNTLARLMLALLLVVGTTSPLLAQDEEQDNDKDKPKHSDIENIGNRNINDGGILGIGGDINFTSLDKEIALGRSLAADLERQVQLIDDPIITEYVNRVGQNLVRNSDAKVPFTFKVVQDDSINALALPGGFVYVNTGILLAADEEAELAGVMAHEIAHVAARHGTENQSKSTLLNILSIPLIFVGGVPGIALQQTASLAIPMSMYSFSRGAEEEADYLGMQYMYKAGYDPGAAITFFEKVQALETARPGSVSSVFASHPPTEARIEKTKHNIAVVLPEREQYVLTTSEFADVKERMVAYYNRTPQEEDEEDSGRPTLSVRTQRPSPDQDPADETVTSDGPPRLERPPADGDADAANTDTQAEPEPLPEDPDRPVLRRPEGSSDNL
jgi:Peptidase family M48